MNLKPAALVLFLLCTVVTSAHARSRKHPVMDAVQERIDEALVKAPVDGEVCFAPEEPCDTKLVKFVDSARKSIDIAIYDVNLDRLVHELVQLSRRLPVRIVVDRKQAKGAHSLVPTLIRAGAQVRYGRQRGIMHNKFAIVDGRMIETGSFNYTHHASRSNNENQVYLANPAIVERFSRRFEKIWAEADPVS